LFPAIPVKRHRYVFASTITCFSSKKPPKLLLRGNWDSSVSVVTGSRAGRFGVRLPARKEIFLLSERSKPPVDPIQTSVEYVPGALPGRPSVRGVKLLVYILLVPKLRVCGAIPLFFTYTPSWRAQL